MEYFQKIFDGNKAGKIFILEENGSEISNPEEIANKFNAFL